MRQAEVGAGGVRWRGEIRDVVIVYSLVQEDSGGSSQHHPGGDLVPCE